MTVRRHWTQNYPSWFNEDLAPDEASTVHLIEYQVEIPDGAHIVRLICSGGVSIRGHSEQDLDVLSMPMSWIHQVTMLEGPSDAFPSGRLVMLNAQAGELVTAIAVKPRDATAFTGTPRIVATTYSGHMQPVDQPMSYGSTTQHIGAREIFARFHIHGVHGMDGGSDPPWYTFGGAGCMRVLYELDT
jgi:hypothetical protein